MNHSLAKFLIQAGLLDSQLCEQYLNLSQHKQVSFIFYLVNNNILSAELIAQSCAKHFGLAFFDMENYDLKWLHQNFLTLEFIKLHRVIPMQIENNILTIGISDPTNREAINATLFTTGLAINPVIIAEDKLVTFLNTNCNANKLTIPKELLSDLNQNTLYENQINYDEPLIRFVDDILQDAISQNASDIHIEPFEKICKIRYRKDGILHLISEIPSPLAARLTTRLKVMAKLDIAERRLPQDGRLQSQTVDIRINTCPIQHGEKIVLRLLDTHKSSLKVKELGLLKEQENIFLNKISQSQGLIVVTGPTGSGKTITLYSAINHLNTYEKNILTVEDPVEIQINGVNQVSTHAKIGLDFSQILRNLLRQDPDIIMIGEIRDHETAKIAVQAAHTGHLVFSTLHANSALETLTRLQSIGISPYNIVSSTSLIIAQRLIRKLCDHCKQLETPSPILKHKIYRANGCKLCLKGYQGRMGIYEILPMTDKLAELIITGTHSITLAKHAIAEGFKTLYESGMERVKQGITSLAELNRVTQNGFT